MHSSSSNLSSSNNNHEQNQSTNELNFKRQCVRRNSLIHITSELKKEFPHNLYPTRDRCIELGHILGLSEGQVKNWFSAYRIRYWKRFRSGLDIDQHAVLAANMANNYRNRKADAA